MRFPLIALLLAAVACSTSSNSNDTTPTRDGGLDASAGPTQPAGWDDDVRVAELPDLNPDPNVVEVNLEAKVARIDRLGLEMWTYAGGVPGPTIHAKKGDRVIVHFKNSLPEATTIHWHGLRVPNAMDGMPMVQTPIAPGGTFDYVFTVPDAGTFWYHPHVDSSKEVGYGLYGAFVVDDPASPIQADDVVLVLSDASVTDAGVLETPDAMGGFGDYFGREGGLILVNGKTHPTLRARPGLPQRWRVINASRARYAQIKLGTSAAATVTRIGGDGGLATTAVRLADNSTLIVPGERVELWVVPTAPFTMSWDSYDRFHAYATPKSFPVLDVVTEGDLVKGKGGLPAKLGDVAALGVDAGAPSTRTIHFTDNGGTLGIDGKSGDMTDMFHVMKNTTEVWTIANDTGQDHPFHIHGFSFQVISGTGQVEWKDTVNVVARQRVTVAIPFDDRTGNWMFHCHILDHADSGMMAMFMVM